eukprot:15482292-Alexandrium_andersonii.AAC.1
MCVRLSEWPHHAAIAPLHRSSGHLQAADPAWAFCHPARLTLLYSKCRCGAAARKSSRWVGGKGPG